MPPLSSLYLVHMPALLFNHYAIFHLHEISIHSPAQCHVPHASHASIICLSVRVIASSCPRKASQDAVSMFQLPATCSLLPLPWLPTTGTLLLVLFTWLAPTFLFLTFVPDPSCLLTSRAKTVWGFAAKSIGAIFLSLHILARSTYIFVGLRSHLGHD
ncbi:hypothetical protein COCSADRAFT_242104 [Bipolaris sorokiniana ND90Pr]|uniref:Uncharacterized protein n=1 Tax=Cochliobolus sativus (strain ND90Pr / ATCC 201652) TaxID=665912 RepID=M2SU95_COCSN|nr:uncharacterized protein COCSADRAFT_242104 [Bipolaris sorokiniana ND90Pr]EMD60372.1 hypothetical protein COCSADRAFT_242104 [Bipolaris sorokiniana ND90Pr]